MTIREALSLASTKIPPKEAQILLASHLQSDRLTLIAHDDNLIEDEVGYFALVDRAQQGEPIEYLTQTVSFYRETFFIQKGALIPRPESEILIDKTVEIARHFSHPTIAEIGTGSGIIAVMLAKLLPDAKIIATDISPDALKIAQTNLSLFHLSDRISLIHSPYLEKVDGTPDIIVSNPPYIAHNAPLEHKLSYEPKEALFGGQKGDEILKDIIDLACDKGVSYLCCEMGYDQKKSMQNYLQAKGVQDIAFYQDLAGFDRGFIAKVTEK